MALTQRDVLLYFGHGSGAQYMRGRRVRRLDKIRAAALLMGCSSARLGWHGEFEVDGPVADYLLAGCPAVVGTLWDVTDKEIDRFAGRVFEEWGLLSRGTFPLDQAKRGGRSGGAKGKGKAVVGGKQHVPDAAGAGYGQASLVEAVARARDAPRFRYLTSAAVVVYGIPVYVDREGR